MCSVEDCVELARLGLFNEIAKSEEELLVASRGTEYDGIKSTNEFNQEKIDNRAEEVRRKELHGQYFRQTDEVASYNTWVWVQQGHGRRRQRGS